MQTGGASRGRRRRSPSRPRAHYVSSCWRCARPNGRARPRCAPDQSCTSAPCRPRTQPDWSTRNHAACAPRDSAGTPYCSAIAPCGSESRLAAHVRLAEELPDVAFALLDHGHGQHALADQAVAIGLEAGAGPLRWRRDEEHVPARACCAGSARVVVRLVGEVGATSPTAKSRKRQRGRVRVRHGDGVVGGRLVRTHQVQRCGRPPRAARPRRASRSSYVSPVGIRYTGLWVGALVSAGTEKRLSAKSCDLPGAAARPGRALEHRGLVRAVEASRETVERAIAERRDERSRRTHASIAPSSCASLSVFIRRSSRGRAGSGAGTRTTT